MVQLSSHEPRATPAHVSCKPHAARICDRCLCARTLRSCLHASTPVPTSLMALPVTFGQPAQPAPSQASLLWLSVWTRYLAACRVNLAMRVWWRRRNRGVEPSQLCYRAGFGDSQSPPTPAQRSWFCANQRTLNRQPVYGRDSFSTMSLCILHRLLRWVDQQTGAAGNRGRRKRDRGDKLAPSLQRYYMTGHRFMTTMDLLERAALLSAFQMTLHLPSWREVTAART